MINELYTVQKQLNDRILVEHNLNSEDLVNEKYMAFLVELGEFANETRCFKYWSTKGPSASNIIIEELSDVLHFLLTIGIMLDEPHLDFYLEETERDLTELFLSMYNDTNLIINTQSKFVYVRMFNTLMQIASQLGFNEQDVYNSYMNKNKINHQRQDNGY